MAVERRVKPSAKVKAEMSKKRKPLLLAGALVLVLVVAGVVAVVYGAQIRSLFGAKNPDNEPINKEEAMRAVLASSVSYDGRWYIDPNKRFQVYLPGTVESSIEDLNSVTVNACEGDTGAFGVTVGTEQFPSLAGQADKDSHTVLESVLPSALSDIGAALYGTKFSGSYDISSITLTDGSKALWLSGELQTVLGLQHEGSSTVTEVTMTFPLYGFVTLKEDTPIFVWGAVDPDDKGLAMNLETYMRECAGIFSAGVSSVVVG